ncbi:hypothetical protein [Chitinivorax sp. B]|uniref:hypothetical protein n=1 Tax=Chitinivorax sp. B TaxID=2502235 RepID=UPI0010F5DE8B|nr:hypothetical protein [Chitinivorax sp. B]
MAHYPLTERLLPEPTDLTCRYQIADLAQTDQQIVLIVSFGGTYPDGSHGNAHAAYIARSTLLGLHAFDADCVILDFRGLVYRWGNSLLRVFDDIAQYKDAGGEPGQPTFPVLVVTSELCSAAFLSLVTPVGQSTPAWHFEDMDAAIQYGMQKAHEWLDF